MSKKDDILDDLIFKHNEARINRFLWKRNPLRKNDELMQHAQEWAYNMAQQNRLYHGDIFKIMDLGFSSASENIAHGQINVNEVMQSWMLSLGHRSNILNRNFTDIGCGVASSEQDARLFWCVCFGQK